MMTKDMNKDMNKDKVKALEAAISQIEKNFSQHSEEPSITQVSSPHMGPPTPRSPNFFPTYSFLLSAVPFNNPRLSAMLRVCLARAATG